MAQPGSAPALGAGGRWFKSSRPDQRIPLIPAQLTAQFPPPSPSGACGTSCYRIAMVLLRFLQETVSRMPLASMGAGTTLGDSTLIRSRRIGVRSYTDPRTRQKPPKRNTSMSIEQARSLSVSRNTGSSVLVEAQGAEARVFDLSGRVVERIACGEAVEFTSRAHPAGVYFAVLSVGNTPLFIEKLVLLDGGR